MAQSTASVPHLPEGVFWDLVKRTGKSVHDMAKESWLFHKRPVKIIDGSTILMPDTEANQAGISSSAPRSLGWGSRSRASWSCSA